VIETRRARLNASKSAIAVAADRHTDLYAAVVRFRSPLTIKRHHLGRQASVATPGAAGNKVLVLVEVLKLATATSLVAAKRTRSATGGG
jgi:hypothetical protein